MLVSDVSSRIHLKFSLVCLSLSLCLSHVVRGCCAEPIIRENAAGAEIRGAEERALEGEVPVGHGDGGIDRLQGLLEHERQGHVGGHEAGSLVPAVAVLRAA